MGLAISGMHYTAMAASKLAVGSYCLGGASFDNDWLAGTIGLVTLGILALTLITAVYDAHLVSQTRQDAMRLEQVNVALATRQESARARDARRRHFFVGTRHREPQDAVDGERDRIAARGGRGQSRCSRMP